MGVKNWEKSEMFDEMGQNSSKFGNFDTNRCAPGVGPQKCWFCHFFPIFGGVKIHSSYFSGSTDSSSRPLLALINPGFNVELIGCGQKQKAGPHL